MLPLQIWSAAMTKIRQMAQRIIAREGGFVVDPDDPGGPTNLGVTLSTLQSFGDDLNNDGRIDINDLRALSPQEAEEIFIRHYFLAPGIPELPAPLHETLFDMFVHAGHNAIRILQEMLGKFGQPVGVDGIIGPMTREATKSVMQTAPEHCHDAYGIERRNYYFRLADLRSSLRKYTVTKNGQKGGWITRAENFIQPKYHLSDQEFRKRIAPWV